LDAKGAGDPAGAGTVKNAFGCFFDGERNYHAQQRIHTPVQIGYPRVSLIRHGKDRE
jgi:hypothetical protein